MSFLDDVQDLVQNTNGGVTRLEKALRTITILSAIAAAFSILMTAVTFGRKSK